MRCFYDADEQLELWGKPRAEELPAIYGGWYRVVLLGYRGSGTIPAELVVKQVLQM